MVACQGLGGVGRHSSVGAKFQFCQCKELWRGMVVMAAQHGDYA